MKASSYFRLFVPAAILIASIGSMSGGALAQQAAPTWKPSLETVIVEAAKLKNYRLVMSNTRIGDVIAVTASLQVPYADLHLATATDASELQRRIGVAARLVCLELDAKYPPEMYAIVQGDDCEMNAAKDGMVKANQVIAAAKN
jgi:UrcA family protein